MIGTPTAARVREELLSHLKSAMEASAGENVDDERIHAARKELKRARANLRLLRDAIGEPAYARENAALRDAARPLSLVRDAKVLIDTTDHLLERTDPQLKGLLRTTRASLEKSRREARAKLRSGDVLDQSAASISAAAQRIRSWQLGKARPAAVQESFRRTYRRGRKAFGAARADATAEDFHEWRKQVKYLEQSMRVFNAGDVPKTSKMLKRAGTLADVLGTDHDLVVFADRMKNLNGRSRGTRALQRDIEARRRKLQSKALKQGRRLFGRKPLKFIGAMTRSARVEDWAFASGARGE